MRPEPVPSDVARLVIAARNVAFDDAPSLEALGELDQASEAFADRVPWDDEPASHHSPLQDRDGEVNRG